MAVPTLLRPWVARLLGFAALATLGALEWERMIAGVGAGRALLWVAVALAAAVAVRLSAGVGGRWGGWAPLGIALLALVAAFAVAPLDLGLLRPARWTELGEGLSSGAEALGTVRLPYEGIDPWPGLVLGLLGSTLCVLAGLLAFWPRVGPAAGYPFFSLVALLTLVITPVISLGGTPPLLLGVAIAALIICFLWLERLPLRPGLGVAVLLAFAVAGGVPSRPPPTARTRGSTTRRSRRGSAPTPRSASASTARSTGRSPGRARVARSCVCTAGIRTTCASRSSIASTATAG